MAERVSRRLLIVLVMTVALAVGIGIHWCGDRDEPVVSVHDGEKAADPSRSSQPTREELQRKLGAGRAFFKAAAKSDMQPGARAPSVPPNANESGELLIERAVRNMKEWATPEERQQLIETLKQRVDDPTLRPAQRAELQQLIDRLSAE